jgi:5-methylcytosine-specific restriction enzyme subunit McrC
MKIPIENIYYLLCYSWNKLDEAEQVNVNAKDFTELIDLFAVVLKNGINQLIKRGFDRNYIEYSEDTRRLRGKIDFAVTLKKNLMKKAQLHCRFDDLSHNVLHNKIIKSTINNLINIENIDKDIKDELRDLYLKLRGIDLIKIENKHFRMIQLNSNNYFYDFLLNICELIHDNIFIDENSGRYKFKSFIDDNKKMAHLFEDFIRNFYKIELLKAQQKTVVKRDSFGWYSEEEDDNIDDILFPKMETDVSITFPNKKIVIEVKYYTKILIEHYGIEKLRSEHIRQLYTYLKNLEQFGGLNLTAEGILLYPLIDKEINTERQLKKHKFKVRTINLNQNWKNIHNDLIKLIIN